MTKATRRNTTTGSSTGEESFGSNWSVSPNAAKRAVAYIVTAVAKRLLWVLSAERRAHLEEHLDRAGARSLVRQFPAHVRDGLTSQPANLRPLAAILSITALGTAWVAATATPFHTPSALMAAALLLSSVGCVRSEDRLRAGGSFAYGCLGAGTTAIAAAAIYQVWADHGSTPDSWLLRVGLLIVAAGGTEMGFGCATRDPRRLGDGVRVGVHGALVCAAADVLSAPRLFAAGRSLEAVATIAVAVAAGLTRLALPPFERRCVQASLS